MTFSQIVPSGTEGGSVSWTTSNELVPDWADAWEDSDDVITGLVVAAWDEVVVELLAGVEPARNEADAIMAMDRTNPAMPYFTLRAFSDMF